MQISSLKIRVRSRLLSAVAIVSALAFGGVVATAGVASADDNWKQYCSGIYGGLMTCISYDYTNGNLAVNAHNGNSNGLGYAMVMIRVRHNNVFTKATNSEDVLPGNSWLGEPLYWGRPPGADQVCGFLTGNGEILSEECGNFY